MERNVMPRLLGCVLLMLALGCGTALGSEGRIEWQVERTLATADSPLDMAVTADGKRLYVLLAGGRVEAYSNNGEKLHQIEVDPQADRIEVDPGGSRLYVSSRQEKRLQVVAIDVLYDIDTGGSPSQGPADAPVEIVVFSDFQCPYCAKLVATLEQVAALYPQQVRIVFKNFPLRNHKFARQAAFAALSAQQQGEFWPFHNELFANYNRLDQAKVIEIADQLGLDRKRFEQGLGDRSVWARINADIEEAKRVGVSGTPAVFVAGKRLTDRSLDGFRAQIEKALAGGQPETVAEAGH